MPETDAFTLTFQEVAHLRLLTEDLDKELDLFPPWLLFAASSIPIDDNIADILFNDAVLPLVTSLSN
jgi:hypothetical protein